MSQAKTGRTIIVPTAGFGQSIVFYTGVSCCGKIWNGVSIAIGSAPGGVIAFADLERVYLDAKAHRKTALGKEQLAKAERDYGPEAHK